MYTYRYSRESSTSISVYCPICLAKQEVSIEGTIAFKYSHSIPTDMLCCSKECTALYEKKITKAIAWAREHKSTSLDKRTRAQMHREHYNSIRAKDTNVAKTLAMLGTYFPFASAHDYKVK